ncbi:transcription elongation factor (TFIIS) family protein isoform X2 [Tasmannia lanceolata]|uniref:transcription elongation factor (TFIIS) family protein isoform X2 n=1 Tax=Tasmannia lanceolata TaxID=3420 RepID=UPI004064345F
MDLDDFRSVLRNSGVDVWTLIETAIEVASMDYGKELKIRRDKIVERLYTSACRNCDPDGPRLSSTEIKEEKNEPIVPEASIEKENSHNGKNASPSTPQSIDREEDRDRIYGGGRSIDQEQRKIISIKEYLEDPEQSDDSLVNHLQNLADMDITFKALKETDIGRHVNGLRKHPSSEVRRLVKQLVRKWKDLVDEWVKLNTPGQIAASAILADGDSPQQIPSKNFQNGHQVPDFAYSPNCYNGSSGSDKNNSELESKGKAIPRRETQIKQNQTPPASSTSNKQKETVIDPERLASARRRLHENYQEAQNAKKQRTIQVMDLHDIPKPKNSFFAKNKGGFQAKHW